jgi:thymidine kinase
MTENSKRGSITVYTGCMFSGKTDSMLTAFDRAFYAKQSFICFKPSVDKRFGENIVKSRSKVTTIEATVLPVNGTEEDFEKVLKMVEDIDLVGFDEMQFFGVWIVKLINRLRRMGKKVVLNGLDMDHRGEAFDTSCAVMGIADETEKLHAVCSCCGADAIYSQKLINGIPVTDGSSVDVEDVSGTSKTTYEARCSNCFVYPEGI